MSRTLERPTRTDTNSRYAAKRAYKAANIAPIPKPADRRRRNRCKKSLRKFLETYFANAFPVAWSEDHLEVIDKTQAAIVDGGQFAVAMPRGSGKTTIHQRSAIWAIVYGFRRYVFLVCADSTKAKEALRSIKTEFEFNPLLFADFPEICKPVRELQGAAISGKKQHVDGEPTLIDWKAERAQFAHVKGSSASGSMIGVGGITGAARGAQVALPSGEVMRPSLLLVDDFQTRASAASPMQSRTRLDILTGDLMAMRSPTNPLAALVTATVIYRDDAADQLLDREKYAEWHGVRKQLVYKWPTAEKLWDEYENKRKKALREDRSPTAATSYYRRNRKKMDAGAKVAWPERFQKGELSAIQHAYNLRMADPDAFDSEYQNQPCNSQEGEFAFLDVKGITEKVSTGPLPSTTQIITAGIDVQGNSLWWVLAAWSEQFNGRILAHGVFPEQNRRYFTQTSLPQTLQKRWPLLSEEEAIYRALSELIDTIAGKRWTLDSGVVMGCTRILIDEGYKPEVIHEFCQQSPHAAIVAPAKGHGVKAGNTPMNEWAKRDGERIGNNWRYRYAGQSRSLRHVLFDANYWKTFLHERFAISHGGSGSLSFQGVAGKPLESQYLNFQQIATQLHSEYPIRTEGRGRTVVEWNHKPQRPDNHWFDAAAMAAVAGATVGITLIGEQEPKPKPKKRSKKGRVKYV